MAWIATKQLVQTYGPECVIASLSPFLTEERMTRLERAVTSRISGVQVAIEHPADVHNAFAVMRSCEAFGVVKMHIIGPEFKASDGRKSSGGARRWVEVGKHQSTDSFLDRWPRSDWLLAGAAADGDVAIDELPADKPLALCFGNEHRGLSKKLTERCELTFRIPMQGMVESLNLSVSAAITLYSVTMRRRLECNGDLGAAEKQHLMAAYFIRSLGVEKARLLLCQQNPSIQSPA